MLTIDRKRRILQRLEAEGQVVAGELSAEWKLSEDTIRRDLRELAAEGKLQRVHGGALPASAAMADFTARLSVSADEKQRIARKAATLIERGQTVILDGGTTAMHVARSLPPGLRATVITHSPTVAVELVAHPGIQVQLIGGTLFRHSVVAVGAAAIEMIGRIHADLYLMGVTGIHPSVGLTTGDFEEAHVKRALTAAAAETLVLASPEKLNAASPYVVAPLSDITGLIVDASTPKKTLAPFSKAGLTIHRAA